MYRSLLVPLDGSEFAEHALPLASSGAHRAGADLRLVHINVPLASLYSGSEFVPVLTLDATLRENESAYLQGMVNRLTRSVPVGVSGTLSNGPVADALHEHGLAVAADLVVMATHKPHQSRNQGDQRAECGALHRAAVAAEFGGASITWGLLMLFLSRCASFTLVVTVLVSLPAAYYQDQPVAVRGPENSRGLWGPVCLVKNALGLILIVIGAALALPGVPGQGLLTILVGFMLLDFPRKRILKRKLFGRPGLLSAINRLRERFGKPPLILNDKPAPRVRKDAGLDER